MPNLVDPSDTLTHDEFDAQLIMDWLETYTLVGANKAPPAPTSARQGELRWAHQNMAAWRLVDLAEFGLSFDDAKALLDTYSTRANPYHDKGSGQFTHGPGGTATLEFRPSTVSGAEFHKGIAAARQGDKGAFLSLYTAKEYDDMRTFGAEGGKVGGALKDHGDGRIEIVSLYNNGGSRGAGMKMMDHLIGQGGNYCECYGDSLRGLYEGKGFKLTGSYEFDRSMAADDWNYAKFGTPNYYTLQR